MSQNELYILRGNKIILPTNKWIEEREISDYNEQNKDNLIGFYTEKFQEFEKELDEIKSDFDKSDDKIKFAGLISRKKNYLTTIKAIGDFEKPLVLIENIEEVIKKEIEQNLTQKKAICEEAEKLLHSNDLKLATDQLRELQKRMKDLKVVPDIQDEELRNQFEKIKDEFFKMKQEIHDQFSQELLDNLAKKIEICEAAEALQHSTDWKKTSLAYNELNEEWKKVGIIPKHRGEELWFRFNTAKDIFFNNKKNHFNEIKSEQEQNLQLKLTLIEKANALKDSTEWKATSEAFAQLLEEWKKIGRVPFEKSEEIWVQFCEIKNYFFKNKDAHYTNVKSQLEDNYAKKMAIVKHAEELQDTNDFDQGTTEFTNMFEEWKLIGRVPKEYGDELWERFLKAKRLFFDRKDENRNKRRQEISKNISDRLGKNKSFFNRITKELQNEIDLKADIEYRIQNLPATLRSYEKREELKEVLEEVKKNIVRLENKVKEVKEKLNLDENELHHFSKPPKKATKNNSNNNQDNSDIPPNTQSEDTQKQTIESHIEPQN